VQGFAALPGFSRSGLTISALLLRKFDETAALRLSFLMSLPIVLGGNVLLNLKDGFVLSAGAVFGLVFSFVFGIFTIHVLFRVARKINFAYFVLGFGVITLVAAFL
jgi:undecaprenyl-diphosphatase